MCSGLGGCSKNLRSFGTKSKNAIQKFRGSRGCLKNPSPPLFTPFGKGCPGSNAKTPTLKNTGLPRIGAGYTLMLENAKPFASAVLFVGISRTKWSGLTLPFDLGPLGAPGCKILSSIEIPVRVTVDFSGQAFIKLPLLDNTSLIAAIVYQQFAVLDPGNNGLGIAMSNAAKAKVGF